MKKGVLNKRLAVLLLSAIIVFTFAFDAHSMSWAAGNAGTPKDLTLVSQLEPEDIDAVLSSYGEELYKLYSEEVGIDAFLKAHGKGSIYEGVNFKDFEDIYGWEKKAIKDCSPFYESDYYRSYYKLRTERYLKQYDSTGVYDMAGFLSASKQDFTAFSRDAIKSSGNSDRLILLLQDRLLERLVYESMTSTSTVGRYKYFEDILALRSNPARSRAQEYIYQLFENRVRLQLTEHLVESMQGRIKESSEGLSIKLVSWNGSALSIGGRTVKLMPLGEVFCGYVSLGEIIKSGEYDIKYTRTNDAAAFISRERLLERISLSGGIPTVPIDEILNKPTESKQSILAGEAKGSLAPADMEKHLENEYILKANKAQAVTRELNKLEIYTALKDKGINNNVTKDFEKNKAVWLKNMRTALSAFSKGSGSDGSLDFILYIKQFVNYDRVCRNENAATKLISLRFRDTVLRLKPIEEGELWLLDMLYRMKNIK